MPDEVAKGSSTGKVVYLHIGYGKTGTSSIQALLATNKENLLGLGVLYPTTGLTYGGFKSDSHHGLAVLEKDEIPDDVLRLYSALLDEIESSQEKIIIISSEFFCFINRDYVCQMKNLLSDYEVKVIFYVRNQVKLIESTFLQWQKTGWEYGDDVESFFKMHRDGFNFLQRIQPWIDEFGINNIIAKVYDRRITGDDICIDFLKIFGIEKNINPGKIRANPSLLPDFSNLLGIIDQNKIPDENREEIVIELLKLSDTFLPFSCKRLINKNLRNEIEEYYKDSNKSFAAQLLSLEESNVFLSA